MKWFTHPFSADALLPKSEQAPKAHAAGPHHLALVALDDTEDPTLDVDTLDFDALVRDTTAVAVTLVLERSIALPDDDLVVLLASLRQCGLIADASGNLLPLLFFELARRTLVANGIDTRHKRLLAVLDLSAITTCIHCRSVCADAVTQLANIARDPQINKLSEFRAKARGDLNPEAFARLATQCQKMRELRRREKSDSSLDDEVSQYYYYGPITEIEAFCAAAAAETSRIRGKRSAEVPAVANQGAQNAK